MNHTLYIYFIKFNKKFILKANRISINDYNAEENYPLNSSESCTDEAQNRAIIEDTSTA